MLHALHALPQLLVGLPDLLPELANELELGGLETADGFHLDPTIEVNKGGQLIVADKHSSQPVGQLGRGGREVVLVLHAYRQPIGLQHGDALRALAGLVVAIAVAVDIGLRARIRVGRSRATKTGR